MDAQNYKLVEDLFLKVCDLPPAERDAILAAAGRDQPEIRAQVEQMLIRDEGPGLEPLNSDDTIAGEHITEDDVLQPGAQIGRYRVEHEVARGGMGVVYKVRDQQLQRSLALKIMRPSLSRETCQRHEIELARFLEEAQVTAQLDHPGIVPVHDLGDRREKNVYFTMSLVKGKDLGEIFDLAREEREDWNLPRAVGVLVKACDAIAYAHSNGVIHRDLKPSNIMVGRFGAVYVMDWGLAKIVDRDDLHDIRPRREKDGSPTRIHSVRKSVVASGTVDSPLVTMDGRWWVLPPICRPSRRRD